MPHEPTPETLEISLPFGTWIGVEKALKDHRYELQRRLAQKTSASTAQRSEWTGLVGDLTVAIEKIVDTTASV